MTNEESKIQNKITKLLEKDGFFVLKLLRTTKEGIPDLFCCHKTHANLWVEVKKPTGIHSPLQKHRKKELETYNQKVIVPYSYNDFYLQYQIWKTQI